MITVINIDILVYSSLIFICLCKQLQLRLVISRLNHSKLCSIQHYVIKSRIESQHWRPLWNIWNTIAILFISWICYFQICQTLQTPSGHVFGKRAFTFTGSCCIGDKCNVHSVAHNVAHTVAHTGAPSSVSPPTTATSKHLQLMFCRILWYAIALFKI